MSARVLSVSMVSKDSPKASSLATVTVSSIVHAGTCVSSSAAYSGGSALRASQAFTPSA